MRTLQIEKRYLSNKKILKDTDIYLVDTFGEASSFYQLTNITFMGGSMIPHGGQNPLEPARLDNYIVHGPYIENFKEVYSYLDKMKISSKVKNSTKLKQLLLKNLNYKFSKKLKHKITFTGKKILNENLLQINKYI